MSKQFSLSVLLAAILISAIVGGITGALFSQNQPSNNTGTVGNLGQPLWLVTMNDTTANRALNTTYQNTATDGQAMVVQVFLNATCVAGEKVQAIVLINPNRTLLLNETDSYAGSLALSAKVALVQVELTFYVPWRMYYRINTTLTSSSDALVIGAWFESIPPTGFGLIIQAVFKLRE